MKAVNPSRDSRLYAFGPFCLDAFKRQLLRDGEPVTIPPKAFDTLVVLVEKRDHAVKKDELIEAVWPDSFVEENNLNQYISVLRKALGENGNGSRYIETVPRWGYRFVGNVTERPAADDEVTLHRRTHASLVVREEVSDDALPASRRLGTATLVVSGLALLVAIVALGFAWRGTRATPIAARVEVQSIAVLPFRILDPDPGNAAHLEIGLADALIGRLGRIPRVNVRSTSAVRAYAGTETDPAEVGRALGVDAILDGSIQTSDGRIRVTAQLVSSRDGTSLWMETFDEKLSDIFALQDAIASRVARGLAPVLDGEELRPAVPPTQSAKAYEAYLKGRYLWSKRTTESVRASIECFKAAIEEDPNFALAYAGLADAYSIEAAPLAEPALRKALELDDSIGEAHASMGFYRMFHHWDLPMADRELQLAIELAPNYATAHQWYALCLAVRGRFAEAKSEMARAIECDPVSPNMRADMAQICLFAGDHDAAIAHARSALDLDPNFLFAYQYLFATYAQMGRYDDAMAAYERALSTTPSDAKIAFAAREAYSRAGWEGFCAWRIGSGRESRFTLAALYAGRGDTQKALAELEQANLERDFFLIFIAVEPELAPLRSDPRFVAIARGIGVM